MSSNIPVQRRGDVAEHMPVDSGAAGITNTSRRGYDPTSTSLNLYQLRELEEAEVCRTADATLHNILGSVGLAGNLLSLQATGLKTNRNSLADKLQIDRALDKEDLEELDRLCTAALRDPNLPPSRRAKYEIISASCPGRDPIVHLENAERMMAACQQRIDEGRGSEFSRELLGQLREGHRILMGMVVTDDGR